MTRDAEAEDFDERWEEIVTELSDLDGLELADASEFDLDGLGGGRAADAEAGGLREPGEWEEGAGDDVETVASLSGGPRDWSPAEEDEEDVVLVPVDPDDAAPASPRTRLLWLAAAISVLVSTLVALGAVSGGSSIALGAGALGFALAAIAAFSSSPRAEDVDPFDDGARL
ncbi:MAG: hypothetical protein ACFNKK_05820 [Peptidiphaga sp.]|jgi:hypothetical protein|uniref:hypothetical protein n=1 Tax=Actinobaculum sp. oral taxon 183 TaxID=712888 RepID=UPI0003975FEC|nr:hypothetical protein [Actinobaculum sp. oral taxon 183]ERH16645.1 hypothetical protein HMPREF0043_01809 [Actinobaculum sp. oral taxon 183 str. F0552]